MQQNFSWTIIYPEYKILLSHSTEWFLCNPKDDLTSAAYNPLPQGREVDREEESVNKI